MTRNRVEFTRMTVLDYEHSYCPICEQKECACIDIQALAKRCAATPVSPLYAPPDEPDPGAHNDGNALVVVVLLLTLVIGASVVIYEAGKALIAFWWLL